MEPALSSGRKASGNLGCASPAGQGADHGGGATGTTGAHHFFPVVIGPPTTRGDMGG